MTDDTVKVTPDPVEIEVKQPADESRTVERTTTESETVEKSPAGDDD